MEKNNFRIVLLLASLFFGFYAQSQEISIIPKPAEILLQKGDFIFSDKTRLQADLEALPALDFFKKRLNEGLGMILNETDSGRTSNVLQLKINKQSGIINEGYTLVIDENITITASETKGIFYGIQSLLQLLPIDVYGNQAKKQTLINLPRLIIKDQPRFKYRGLMVDISRHFVTKKDLLKIIDMMAMHKLNVLHLHLTDDHGWRIEIKSYPKLTSVASTGDFSNPDGPEKYYLTQEEIREIVAFAHTRHVLVIPEIEMPGHAGAAQRAYPEYFDGRYAFNPANPETFTFIEKIMDEIISLFPSPYIHIGGDEVGGATNWLEMPDVQNLMKTKQFKTATEVEEYFDRKVIDMLVRKGKRPMGWEEVVNFDVDKKTVIQWWLGHLMPSKNLNKALNNGYSVVMSPNWYVYLDYAQAAGEPGAPWNGNINGPNSLELIYKWEPIPDTLTVEKEALILGVEAALWTEFIKSTSFREYMLYPRMSALSEINWVAKGRKNLQEFQQRMKKQYQRYKTSGVNYRSPGWIGDVKYLIH